jgi:outer membrane PBP1 activator LpoA protein
MSLSIRLFIGLLVLCLAGCAGPIAKRVATDPLAVEADNRLRRGDYQGAMQLYQQLAQTSRYADYFRLRAADTALRAGDGKAARLLADAVNPGELDRIDQDQLLLLKSRLDLSVGRAREAMAKLGSVDAGRLDVTQRIHYHTLKASAYNQLGNMLESARESVTAGPLLGNPEAVQKNNEAIYDALARLPDNALAALQPAPPDVLGGWMALVRILRNKTPAAAKPEIADWRARFPGHPADGAFLDSLGEPPVERVRVTPLASLPKSAPPAPAASSFVGVMLPLSGPYAAAASAIRTGMAAAYDADPDVSKAPLRFVDTQSGDVGQLYRQLVEQGARAVIGPLVKEDVAALARGGDLPVPVLALNQVTEASHDKVYQFGLNPEQEVEQAAGSAWFDGHQNALVLAPATQFGQRMINHFVGYWKRVGGTVAAVKTYPHHGDDFTAPVRDLLAAGRGAPVRASGLPVPEAASGVPAADFVFLVADARDAHLIIPQIAFQQADPVPVYATSHVFGGNADPNADQDLNGLIFCDVPWLLNPAEGGSLSAQSLAPKIRETPGDYVKLIALGIDAYRLVPELDPLQNNPGYRYPGVTGALSLKAGNRLERQLDCAQFQNGTPVVRGTAPILQSAPASP